MFWLYFHYEMNRKQFLKHTLTAAGMVTLNSFVNEVQGGKPSENKMPVLFIGHGSPMNAIEQNEYHKRWVKLAQELPRPKAILTISAHWLTRDTRVTAMDRPQTIHDFGGFPKALYDQQYPAPGAPDYAKLTQEMVKSASVLSDYEWGLDHGTWSFLLPMYPQADIPVYQLSLDYYKPMQYHYDLAKELGALRDKGVMIIGSGNIVHNLRMMNFSGPAYDWAIEFDQKIKTSIENRDHKSIVNYSELGSAAKLAVPTHDHYLPLVYTIALQDKNEPVRFFNETTDLGSISMRSLVIG